MRTFLMIITVLSLCSVYSASVSDKDKKCGQWEGRQLYQGEKGGCYYIKIKNKKRTKIYVDKVKCNC